jgi:uncharacterized protein involved in tolerance to divalent cations
MDGIESIVTWRGAVCCHHRINTINKTNTPKYEVVKYEALSTVRLST